MRSRYPWLVLALWSASYAPDARACSYPSCDGLTVGLGGAAMLTGAPSRGPVAFPANFCTGYPYRFTIELELGRKGLWVRPVGGDWLDGIKSYRDDLDALLWTPAAALEPGVSYEVFWWTGSGPPSPPVLPPDAGPQVLVPNAVFTIAATEDAPLPEEPVVTATHYLEMEWGRQECCVPADGQCPVVVDGCNNQPIDAGPACACWTASYEYPSAVDMTFHHASADTTPSLAGVYRLVQDDGSGPRVRRNWFRVFRDMDTSGHLFFPHGTTGRCYRFEHVRISDGAVTEFPWHCLDESTLVTVTRSTPATRPDRCDAPNEQAVPESNGLPAPAAGCGQSTGGVSWSWLVLFAVCRWRRQRGARAHHAPGTSLQRTFST